MSVHFRNQCMKADDIQCDVPVETKWNNTQPQLVLRGFAESVEIINGIAFIK